MRFNGVLLMAMLEVGSGTIALNIVDSIELLATAQEASPGVMQVFLDISNMSFDDSVDVAIYEAVVSSQAGGAEKAVFYQRVTGPAAAASSVWVSPSIMVMHSWYAGVILKSGSFDLTYSVRYIPTL